MGILKVFIFASVCLIATLLLSGCFNRDMEDSSIPWSRPAAWEDQMPGMGR